MKRLLEISVYSLLAVTIFFLIVKIFSKGNKELDLTEAFVSLAGSWVIITLISWVIITLISRVAALDFVRRFFGNPFIQGVCLLFIGLVAFYYFASPYQNCLRDVDSESSRRIKEIEKNRCAMLHTW